MFSQELEHLIGFQWSRLNPPCIQHVYCFCIQQLTYSVTQNWNWGFTHNFRHIWEVPLYSGYVNFSRLPQLQSNWCIFSNLNILRENLHPRSEPVKSMQNIQTSRASSFFGWIVKLIIYRSRKRRNQILKMGLSKSRRTHYTLRHVRRPGMGNKRNNKASGIRKGLWKKIYGGSSSFC